MPNRKILSVVALALVVVIMLLAVSPSSPFVAKSSTGIQMVACDYDANGNIIAPCSNSFNVPIGQSVVGVGGNPVSKIGIPKAFVLLNYTGKPSSGTFTATERVDYAKGVSDTYPISLSIPTPIPKNFSLTLPASSWTASFLQSKWGQSYGPQVVNVTVANSVVKLVFPAGISPPAKPSAFNFVAQFKLNNAPTLATSTTSSSTTSTTTTSSSTTTTTSTSITTFATSTSTTTVSGGTISTGTVNVWPSATTQVTGGATGTAAANNVLVAVQPGSQSQVTVFLPAILVTQQCVVSCAFSISLMTSGTSVTESLPPSVSNVGGPQDSQIGKWISWSFLASTSQGDTVVVQVNLGSAQIFNQAVIVDGSMTNITYNDQYGRTVAFPVLTAIAPQYQAWAITQTSYALAQTAAANAVSTDPCNHLGPVYNKAACQDSLMSIVGVSF